MSSTVFFMTKGLLDVTVFLFNEKVKVVQTSNPFNLTIDSSNKAICRSTEALGNTYLLFHPSVTPLASLQSYYSKLGWFITAA